MSLKYGLNLKKKAPVPTRRAAFDEEDGDDDDGPDSGPAETFIEEISTFGGSGPSRPKPSLSGAPKPKGLPKKDEPDSRQDLSALSASKAQVKAAEEIDASIFDYDSFLDAKNTVTEAKKAAAKQDAIDRKPKYINNLLDAAARRKQDQQVAKEKLLQKEREAEGDEFADKEKFVTGAYKQQQEENRRLEEEERKKAEEEEERKRRTGGGMQGFYRSMMDQTEQQHQEAMEAAALAEKQGLMAGDGLAKKKTDAELAAELQAKGVNVHLNEEGQITDKRELLSAGLNVAPSRGFGSSGSDHLKSSNRPAQQVFPSRNAGSQQAQRERQTRMMEEQLAAQAKRAREEEDEERARLEKAAKSTKTDKDVSDAKARYLARKAARERGEG
ncbi:hypothetical protein M409DRAFT_67216 [Zasmidium cellare ATCC 36951]|uniref:Nuclear speckle splicing regulatory protein 1 N-terminal domain-containing protein n=1 Tax=Zasmidium cellare ATCC 36951 TaxID=1080233 RepID=A0A6A6CDQ1_ZASCE|nr:uncharacterized protein M409DRAFT_67216 [Zasmidium cellare ATCC 36951]KAF2165357.1 hypothetical protein M409DRAFT_67216 [Zasmidium cellare ATCC 36951]